MAFVKLDSPDVIINLDKVVDISLNPKKVCINYGDNGNLTFSYEDDRLARKIYDKLWHDIREVFRWTVNG
jgi:hypothetical protein